MPEKTRRRQTIDREERVELFIWRSTSDGLLGFCLARMGGILCVDFHRVSVHCEAFAGSFHFKALKVQQSGKLKSASSVLFSSSLYFPTSQLSPSASIDDPTFLSETLSHHPKKASQVLISANNFSIFLCSSTILLYS
jgi:hypothetical protein